MKSRSHKILLVIRMIVSLIFIAGTVKTLLPTPAFAQITIISPVAGDVVPSPGTLEIRWTPKNVSGDIKISSYESKK